MKASRLAIGRRFTQDRLAQAMHTAQLVCHHDLFPTSMRFAIILSYPPRLSKLIGEFVADKDTAFEQGLRKRRQGKFNGVNYVGLISNLNTVPK